MIKNAIRRFQREALAATELVHPNIVTVYDVGEEDGMQVFGDGICQRHGLEAIYSNPLPSSLSTDCRYRATNFVSSGIGSPTSNHSSGLETTKHSDQ